MADRSSTLAIGDKAPDFTLTPANSGTPLRLRDLLAHGPLVLEFLRGTW